MRLQTEGIVLSATRYGDNRLIVNMYTRQEGRRAFLVRLAAKSRGRFRSSYFFPLTQLELVFDSLHSGDELCYLTEARLAYVYRDMYADIRKSSVACFLAEVMGRCISQAEGAPWFYDSLAAALRGFDARRQGVSDFHLFFLLALAGFLGVYPSERKRAEDAYFDLREGAFVPEPPSHRDYLDADGRAPAKCRWLPRSESLSFWPEAGFAACIGGLLPDTCRFGSRFPYLGCAGRCFPLRLAAGKAGLFPAGRKDGNLPGSLWRAVQSNPFGTSCVLGKRVRTDS